MPGAAYMVSNMSATCFFKAASNTVTGAALVRSRGSGYSRMASVAMGLSQYLEKAVNVFGSMSGHCLNIPGGRDGVHNLTRAWRRLSSKS